MDATEEQLAAKLAILKEHASLAAEAEGVELRRLAIARSTFAQSEQYAANQQRLLKQEKELQTLRASSTGEETKKIERQLAQTKAQIKSQKTLTQFYKKHSSEIGKYMNNTEKHQKAITELTNKAVSEGEKNLVKMSETTKEAGMSSAAMLAAAKGAIQGIGGVLAEVYKTPAIALGVFSKQIPGIDSYKTAVMGMPKEIDEAFSKVRASTGMNSKQINDSMVYMLDPLYAQRKEGLFKGMADDAKPLANIGLTADSVGESFSALTKNASFFRPAFVQNNKASATFIGNLVAGLKKVGVPMETSAKNLNRFTKSLRMTPKEAATGLKSLTTVARSLGLGFGEVAANFDAVGGKMVMFGDKSVKVFAKLQAQAVGTGMAIGKLVEFAEGLDTFEGAADKAQGLNAVLGGTFLSVTDLVHADFDEKIELMQGAMADAGIEFDTADKRMKQVIASAAGLSLEEASKMFGNKEAAEEMADSVETSAMSQEELKKRIEDGMSIAEVATKGLSSLAGGADLFNKRIRKGGLAAASALSNEVAEMAKATRDSEAAFIGIAGGLQGLKTGGEVIGSLGKALAVLGANAGGILATITGPVVLGEVVAGGLKRDDPNRDVESLGDKVLGSERKEETKPEVPPGTQSQAEAKERMDNLSKILEKGGEKPIEVVVVTNLDGEKIAEVTSPFVINYLNDASRPA